MKQFVRASEVYEVCLRECTDTNSDEIVGSIEYRLGCSRIRAANGNQ